MVDGPSTVARLPLLVAVVGFFAALLVSISVLASIEWDASALLRVGRDDPSIISYVEERLDHVRPVAPSGHDGKFYFIQANDPFLLDPQANARLIDRPVYRSQRMLYPLFASLGGALKSWSIVWGLLVVNLFAIGLGTWATAKLALALGSSAWLGLAFALNPGMLFELIIDGAGILGWALAVLGVLLLVEGRFTGAVVALAGAVLAREAMILVAVGMALRLWKSGRARAVGLVAVPAVGALVWAIWVRLRLDAPLLSTESEELGIPFEGLARAFSEWIGDPGRNLVFGLVVIAFLLVIALQAARRPSLVSFSTLGFVVMAPLLTRQVWLNYFDITRAVAPVFTSFVLVLFAGQHIDRDGPAFPEATTV